MQSKSRSVKLLLLAILAEIIMMGDSFSLKVSSLFTEDTTVQAIIRYPVNYSIWIIGILFIRFVYKKNSSLHFEYTDKPTRKNAMIAGLLLVITISISYLSWGGFKVYKELSGSINYAGFSLGVADFIAQYFYYFLETILIIIIIACSQEAGENLFKNEIIPYGGIFLALICGLYHIIPHGFIDGMITTFNALIYGIGFLAMKKNINFSFWLIFLMFIL